MESKISLSEFKSNLELVETYIANSSTKKLTRIEYRSFDEGMCDANLFVISKSEVADELEAFVTLCNFQLHFYEEWSLSDTTSENANSILNLWVQPDIESYLFDTLSSSEVHQEIDWIINSIIKLLSDDSLLLKRVRDPDRWGVFVNGERISSETALSDIGLKEIICGIGFALEWNSVDIMYQTKNDYIFFSWGSGA
ncbi:hypothetical protein BS333_16120 [Vibrio azureus]|uniref:Uncharacterized protein n=1 Tax=Vibrio azureus NBRC 104587 TaxID=1219077 RepID=U3A8S7_9VIBR|nr:hypothetical protein [Vibrio azureus]AUI87915.1 hypothetical protein BS333_16120 [Vibrio azureus]GAD76311.1 hypothetical protein VAZ01S_041_00110 [Vibrio azureus NBRC 104587]